jgi:hypothetical protein
MDLLESNSESASESKIIRVHIRESANNRFPAKTELRRWLRVFLSVGRLLAAFLAARDHDKGSGFFFNFSAARGLKDRKWGAAVDLRASACPPSNTSPLQFRREFSGCGSRLAWSSLANHAPFLPYLFVRAWMMLVVLASSTSDDQNFCEIVTLYRPPPHQDWGRVRTAGNRFARDEKCRAPAG